jgi:hypothetical protein
MTRQVENLIADKSSGIDRILTGRLILEQHQILWVRGLPNAINAIQNAVFIIETNVVIR